MLFYRGLIVRFGLLIGLLIGLVACGGSGTPVEQGAKGSPTAVKSTPTPAPLEGKKVQFKTSDGLMLEGMIYGQGTTAVVCSNMIDGGQQDWETLVRHLLAKDYMVMTYDYRAYRGFGDPALAQTPLDLEAAVSFVRGQGAKEVILVGASMGGTVSAAVAAKEKKNIRALVSISGPLVVGALQVKDIDLRAITAPGFFVNSNEDGFVEDTARMYTMIPSPKRLYLYPGSGHGTEIFDGEYSEDLSGRILDFLEAIF